MECGRIRGGFSTRATSITPALIVLTPTAREKQDFDPIRRRCSEERCRLYQKSYGPCGWTKSIRAFAPSSHLSTPKVGAKLPEAQNSIRVRETLANFLLLDNAKLGEKQRKLEKEPREKTLVGQGKAIHPIRKRAPVHIQLPKSPQSHYSANSK